MDDKEKVITVWITKYALTQGVEEKKKFTKKVLKLRLEGCSYPQIAEI